MNEVLKKVLPKSYTLNTMEKPMHSGEIYHLWECLIAGFQLVELLEAYYMNTEDKNIQKIL
ncbi:MAG: hypothetical protein FIA99_03865 [Ruminiclostridium sp.]|nr:hypothetical protein [Ruminiclostridium sp.]